MLQGFSRPFVTFAPTLCTPGPAEPQLLRAACQAGARLDAQLALVSVMLGEAGQGAMLPPEMAEEYADEMGGVARWMSIQVGGQVGGLAAVHRGRLLSTG